MHPYNFIDTRSGVSFGLGSKRIHQKTTLQTNARDLTSFCSFKCFTLLLLLTRKNTRRDYRFFLDSFGFFKLAPYVLIAIFILFNISFLLCLYSFYSFVELVKILFFFPVYQVHPPGHNSMKWQRKACDFDSRFLVQVYQYFETLENQEWFARIKLQCKSLL